MRIFGAALSIFLEGTCGGEDAFMSSVLPEIAQDRFVVLEIMGNETYKSIKNHRLIAKIFADVHEVACLASSKKIQS